MTVPLASNPFIPFVSDIPGGFTPGILIYIHGCVPTNACRFGISLQCGQSAPKRDIALYTDMRFNDCYLTINSKVRAQWGDMMTFPIPLRKGQQFESFFLCEPEWIKVMFNDQELPPYKHRTHYSRISHIGVNGDVRIFTIATKLTQQDNFTQSSTQQIFQAYPPAPMYQQPGYPPSACYPQQPYYQQAGVPQPVYQQGSAPQLNVPPQSAPQQSAPPQSGYPQQQGGYPSDCPQLAQQAQCPQLAQQGVCPQLVQQQQCQQQQQQQQDPQQQQPYGCSRCQGPLYSDPSQDPSQQDPSLTPPPDLSGMEAAAAALGCVPPPNYIPAQQYIPSSPQLPQYRVPNPPTRNPPKVRQQLRQVPQPVCFPLPILPPQPPPVSPGLIKDVLKGGTFGLTTELANIAIPDDCDSCCRDLCFPPRPPPCPPPDQPPVEVCLPPGPYDVIPDPDQDSICSDNLSDPPGATSPGGTSSQSDMSGGSKCSVCGCASDASGNCVCTKTSGAVSVA